MFQITKFVIAAALTAIIAAPIMAQADPCPCWTAVELRALATDRVEVCTVPQYTFTELEGGTGTYVLEYMLAAVMNGYSVNNDGTEEYFDEAEVYVAPDSISGCHYEIEIDEAFNLTESINPDQFDACVDLVRAECVWRGINPVDTRDLD